MKTVALIGCVKTKANRRCKARDMYLSPLFRLSYKYAKQRKVDNIYILSAKYGLISEDTIISPYNKTLLTMSDIECRNWGGQIMTDIKHFFNINDTRFIVLAGDKYSRWLRNKLPYLEEPLRGLSMGQRLQFLKSKINTR